MNNIHPVSTLTDATQHTAGKRFFCKLDCSQASHCLQMADQRSIEMLAFNFARRTFAYKRLAEGFSRALSAYSELHEGIPRQSYRYQSGSMCSICGSHRHCRQ